MGDSTCNNSDLEEDKNFHQEILEKILINKIPRWKKLAFEYFHSIHSTTKFNAFELLEKIFIYLGIAVRQLQFIFILSTACKTLSSSETGLKIHSFLEAFMFGKRLIDMIGQTYLGLFPFFFTSSFMVCSFTLILQLYFKKKYLKFPFLIFIKLSLFLYENILFIPLSYFFWDSVKSLTLSNSPNYYDLFDKKYSYMFIAFNAFELIVLYFKALFIYNSHYYSTDSRCRSCSIVTVKQMILTEILCFLFVFIDKSYALCLSFFISACILKDHLYYLPYYSFPITFGESGIWIVNLFFSSGFIVNLLIDIKGDYLFCLVLTIPLVLIIYYHRLKDRIKRITDSEIDTPISLELKVRKILYMKNTISSEEVEYIEELFKKNTNQFLEYKPVFIWEVNFMRQAFDDYELEMLKLLKMQFAEFRPRNLKKPEKLFRYPLDIETQYFCYCYYKKNKIDLKKNNEFELIKYLKKLYELHMADFNFSKEFLMSICSISNKNDKKIEEHMLEFYKQYELREKLLAENLKKYGNDKNMVGIAQIFDETVLNPREIIEIENQYSFIEKTIGYKSEILTPCLVVSGDPKSLGSIIYANQDYLQFFKYSNVQDLLKKNIAKLVPKYIQEKFKNELSNAVLFSSKCEINLDTMFFCDSKGYSIETSMKIKLVYSHNAIYFIMQILPKMTSESFVVFSPQGEIKFYSESMKNKINENCTEIEVIFPWILNKIKTKKKNSVFSYKMLNEKINLRWKEMALDKEKLIVLCYSENAENIEVSSFEIQKKNRKNQNRIIDLSKNDEIKEEDQFNIKCDNRFQNISSSSLVKLHFENNSVLKYIKALRYAHFLGIIILIMIYVTIIFIISYNIKFSESFTIVKNLNSLRSMLSSIGQTSRSINLISQNYPCYYTRDSYLENNNNYIAKMDSILSSINSIDSSYHIAQNLKAYQAVEWEYINGTESLHLASVYESLHNYKSKSQDLSNSGYMDNDLMLYSIKNSFNSMFLPLNFTIGVCLEKMKTSYLFILYITEQLNILSICIIPLLLLTSLPMLLKIISMNRKQWEIISKISQCTLQIMRDRLIILLSKNYYINIDHIILESYAYKKCFERIWKKYILKLILLQMFCIAYFIGNYYLESLLGSIIQLRNNRFYFGSLRSGSSHLFTLARELYLKPYNISYVNLYEENLDYGSIQGSFEFYKENSLYIFEKSIRNCILLFGKNIYFNDYSKFYFEDACSYVNIENCSTSFLNLGIHYAFIDLIQELSYYVYQGSLELNSIDNANFIKNLEMKTSMFISTIITDEQIFETFTYNIINSYINICWYLTGFIIGINILLFVLVLLKEIEIIKRKIISKNIFMLMLNRSVNNTSLGSK